MIRAILREGQIEPLDPIPPEWGNGQELRVEQTVSASPENTMDIDLCRAELEAVIAQMPDDPDDARRFHDALAEADRIAKELVRREMGLAG
jgi:hypothetical protein